jgi:hypothetical protein
VVRIDAHQLPPAADDSPAAEAVKVLARHAQDADLGPLCQERAAVGCGCGAQVPPYFPAAVAAFAELDAPDVLELLGNAPDPARAAKLTRARLAAVLKLAERYKIKDRTDAILAALAAHTWASRPP